MRGERERVSNMMNLALADTLAAVYARRSAKGTQNAMK